MGLKPEIRQYLSERSALGLPAVWQAPLDEIRKITNLHIALSQPLIDLFEVKKILIPGPKSDLPVRIYRPSQKFNLPALVFFHGGGWVLNFLDIYEPALRKLALAGDFVIIAVEYQKAPEHPYPAAFNDCFATLEWVVKNAMRLEIDPKAIGVGGDSAGGNLASAVALKVRDLNLLPLAYQLLIYPCNDYEMNYKSANTYAENFGLTSKAMRWFWEQYLADSKFQVDPCAVPAKAATLTGLAPALIFTAENDPLVDDGKNYYELLVSHSVPAFYKDYPGQIHGFFNLSGVTADAELLYSDISREINTLLGRDKK
jgi:acetyl esterase